MPKKINVRGKIKNVGSVRALADATTAFVHSRYDLIFDEKCILTAYISAMTISMTNYKLLMVCFWYQVRGVYKMVKALDLHGFARCVRTCKC